MPVHNVAESIESAIIADDAVSVLNAVESSDSIISIDGMPLICFAARFRAIGVVSALSRCERYRNLHDYEDGSHALHFASSTQRNSKVIRQLVRDIDVDRADSDGATPLIWAAAARCIENMKVLLDCGASTNVWTNRGESALSYGVSFESKKMCSLLIRRGASLTRRSPDGGSALEFALINSSKKFILFLVDEFRTHRLR